MYWFKEQKSLEENTKSRGSEILQEERKKFLTYFLKRQISVSLLILNCRSKGVKVENINFCNKFCSAQLEKIRNELTFKQ